jgi:hypothetical protein
MEAKSLLRRSAVVDPWFLGLVPLYTEVAVLLEHRGYERGEAGGGAGRLRRAGGALGEWARNRLAQQRGQDAFRLVESEMVLLVRSQRLHEIPGLDRDVVADVAQLAGEVIGAGRPPPAAV